jgi:hypothetical protein
VRGTLLNVVTIVVGAALGALLGRAVSVELQGTLKDGIGLVTLLLGGRMAVRTRNVILVLAAILLGAVVGETVHIQQGLVDLAHWFDAQSGGSQGDFMATVLTPTLVFCVGPITLMGCLEDGLTGKYPLLATKSVLDGFSAMAFAAALGWRVGLSAAAVLLIQGALTLGARSIQKLLTPDMTRELFATGGVLLLGLGVNLLALKQTDVRVPALLPSLVLAPLFVSLSRRFAH